jgi:hypothetical protein
MPAKFEGRVRRGKGSVVGIHVRCGLERIINQGLSELDDLEERTNWHPAEIMEFEFSQGWSPNEQVQRRVGDDYDHQAAIDHAREYLHKMREDL